MDGSARKDASVAADAKFVMNVGSQLVFLYPELLGVFKKSVEKTDKETVGPFLFLYGTIHGLFEIFDL